MAFGSALGLVALLAVAFAPSVVVLWVAALAAGVGERLDRRRDRVGGQRQHAASARAAAMAGWNALTGARGIVAAFLMSALLQVGARRRHDRAAALRRLDRDRGRALRDRAGMEPAATATVVAPPAAATTRLTAAGRSSARP